MTDWTPENNRIQTVHLTADELAALQAAKWGWFVVEVDGSLSDLTIAPSWVGYLVYRAKPAPVTQDVVPWGAIAPKWQWSARDENGRIYVFSSDPVLHYSDWDGDDAARVEELLVGLTPGTCDWRDSLQQRPQPAATGAVTEPLEKAGLGLKRIVEEIDGAMKHGTWRDEHGMRLKDTPEWVEFYNAITEASAVAHAKRMTGGV